MDWTSVFISTVVLAMLTYYIYENENKMRKMEGKIGNQEREISELKKTGIVYPRWGKSVCTGEHTDTLYSGQVGGGHYTHRGTSVNYICLPSDPDDAKPMKTHDYYSYLYGAEYELFDQKPEGIKSGIGNHDVACAVCFAKGKTTSVMIPGKKNCYKGWTKEYEGYLMAGYHGHAAASEYACVDKDTDVIPGGAADQNGILFYAVKTQCGSLKCPNYKADTEVPCVVCSN